MKHFLAIFIFFSLFSSTLWSQTTDEENRQQSKVNTSLQNYVPQIGGVIRSKYEYNITDNQHRFQVRNMRFNLTGHVHPMISYKAEVDLSDAGSLLVLDAYGRVTPLAGFEITLGQMKMPFSTENLRGPHSYFFANRSFLAKQMSSGLRDVGMMLSYKYGKKLPFAITTGIFNGDGLYNQSEWQSQFNYAFRAELSPARWLNLSVNLTSIRPQEMRMTLYDIGAYAKLKQLHLETEYIYKTYENNLFSSSQAFLAFVNYDFILKNSFLYKISALARYDYMSDNNRGLISSTGSYEINDFYVRRITIGATLSLLQSKLAADLRLNYEKYLTHLNRNDVDKLVLELVIKF